MAFLPQNEMPVSAERKDHESVTGVPENTGQLRGKSDFVDRADPASVPVREHHTGNLTADPRWRTVYHIGQFVLIAEESGCDLTDLDAVFRFPEKLHG